MSRIASRADLVRVNHCVKEENAACFSAKVNQKSAHPWVAERVEEYARHLHEQDQHQQSEKGEARTTAAISNVVKPSGSVGDKKCPTPRREDAVTKSYEQQPERKKQHHQQRHEARNKHHHGTLRELERREKLAHIEQLVGQSNHERLQMRTEVDRLARMVNIIAQLPHT